MEHIVRHTQEEERDVRNGDTTHQESSFVYVNGKRISLPAGLGGMTLLEFIRGMDMDMRSLDRWSIYVYVHFTSFLLDVACA